MSVSPPTTTAGCSTHRPGNGRRTGGHSDSQNHALTPADCPGCSTVRPLMFSSELWPSDAAHSLAGTPTRYTSIVGCPAVGDTTTTTIESGCHRPPIGTINPPDLSEHVCWVRWQRSGPFHVDGRQRWRPGYRGLVAVARHGFNGWRQRLLQPRQPPTRIVVRP